MRQSGLQTSVLSHWYSRRFRLDIHINYPDLVIGTSHTKPKACCSRMSLTTLLASFADDACPRLVIMQIFQAILLQELDVVVRLEGIVRSN